MHHFALALFGEQIHHHPSLFGTHGQIHGAAHGGNGVFFTGVPVGQIAGGRHLKRPQHANVQVTAAHHGKAVGVVKVGAAGQDGDRLFTGVDQVKVFLARARGRPHAKQAVFTVQQHFFFHWNVVGHQSGHANSQIDHMAFVNVLRHAGGQLVFGATLVAHVQAAFLKPPASVAVRAILTILLTKIAGVTMASGSKSPSSTISCTLAMVCLQAMAMVGPKLRAVLR